MIITKNVQRTSTATAGNQAGLAVRAAGTATVTPLAPQAAPASAPTSTDGDLRAQLEAMRAENAALKAKAAKAPRGEARISAKLSEKGAISVYGLGRFPVTLYGAQWVRLMAEGKDLLAFVAACEADGTLRGKDETLEAYCARLGKPVPTEK